jgi:hypothetical protein
MGVGFGIRRNGSTAEGSVTNPPPGDPFTGEEPADKLMSEESLGCEELSIKINPAEACSLLGESESAGKDVLVWDPANVARMPLTGCE